MFKKLLVSGAAAAMFLTGAANAFAATPNWNIQGTWTFNDIYQSVPYVHTMNITSFNPVTGDFSGTGFYNADPLLTWTITGNESGNAITYTLLTGGDNPGVTLNGTGTVSSATFMSGTGSQSNIDGYPNPNVDWSATGTATPSVTTKDQCKNNGWKTFGVFKNQGDCVSYVSTGGRNLPAGQ
jgi:hypothetical protein